MESLVLASRNKGKLRELKSLLSGWNLQIQSLADFPAAPEVVEDGATFVENAVKKAVSIAEYCCIATLADDSGLEVDALQGRPGVLSARFAGSHGDDAANNRLLLEMLHEVPVERRTARFRCAIAIAEPGGAVYTAQGSCEGRIIDHPRGGGGFGYDPLFFLPEYGMTMAELPEEEKNRVSHRARAMQEALVILRELVGQ